MHLGEYVDELNAKFLLVNRFNVYSLPFEPISI